MQYSSRRVQKKSQEEDHGFRDPGEGTIYTKLPIEIQVTPEREHGFDAIAERIYRFPQVRALYLMSGSLFVSWSFFFLVPVVLDGIDING